LLQQVLAFSTHTVVQAAPLVLLESAAELAPRIIPVSESVRAQPSFLAVEQVIDLLGFGLGGGHSGECVEAAGDDVAEVC